MSNKSRMDEKINTKTNWWGVISCVSMLFTLSFSQYPLMRQYISPGLVVVILSGSMALKEVKRIGWPTYEGSARWNAEMRDRSE